MKYFSFKGVKPKFGNTNYVAEGAKVIGDVNLGENANIWFNCVLRGDVNSITVGKNVNIQDLTMVHVTHEEATVIEDNVSIGHSVIIHSATIKEGCLIGMGAKILDGAVIGKNSVVAAGSVVPPNKEYPEGSFIIGTPAIVKRALTEDEIEKYSKHYQSYVGYAKEFQNECIEID